MTYYLENMRDRMRNFNAISKEVFNLCYLNLGQISLIVWKLWAFQQHDYKITELCKYFEKNNKSNFHLKIDIDLSDDTNRIQNFHFSQKL